MDSISHALGRIKSHLDEVLPKSVIEGQARALGHRWRNRKLSPALTIHLLVLQLPALMAPAGVSRDLGARDYDTGGSGEVSGPGRGRSTGTEAP